jgi:protein gp37
MAENSHIQWCDHTHNPWIGCQKVSAGCDNCFAETMMDKRYHRVEWGQRKTETTQPSVGTRILTSEANRRKPVVWNKHHTEFQAKHGHRQRVFCASLSDVFDNQAPEGARADLFNLIGGTPNLDWLLLTKRPENIAGMMPGVWLSEMPSNIWIGTTCEDQAAYDRRWPILQQIPARVRFISYEPALSGLTLTHHDAKPSWLIAGGESGQGHRYDNPIWYYRLMDECEKWRVPFFMKQLAGRKPIPDDLLIRQFPSGIL